MCKLVVWSGFYEELSVPTPISEMLIFSSRGCTKLVRNPNFAYVVFLGTSKISKYTSWGTFWYQSRRILGRAAGYRPVAARLYVNVCEWVTVTL